MENFEANEDLLFLFIYSFILTFVSKFEGFRDSHEVSLYL